MIIIKNNGCHRQTLKLSKFKIRKRGTKRVNIDVNSMFRKRLGPMDTGGLFVGPCDASRKLICYCEFMVCIHRYWTRITNTHWICTKTKMQNVQRVVSTVLFLLIVTCLMINRWVYVCLTRVLRSHLYLYT